MQKRAANLWERGQAALQAGRYAEAAGTLGKLTAMGVRDYQVHFLHGNALALSGNLARAAEALNRAAQAKSDVPEVRFNLGVILFRLGRAAEAVAHLEAAAKLKPDNPEAWARLGQACQALGALDQAEVAFRRALEIQPDNGRAMVNLYVVLQHLCDWDGQAVLGAALDAETGRALAAGETPAETPFLSVTRTANPARNLAVARAWSAKIESLAGASPAAIRPAADDAGPITLGYLSGDFHAHATMHLMGALFGLHDRARFRVRAYAYGAGDGSAERRRAEAGVDAFIDVDRLSPEAAAERIRADGVDILIDLKGHTQGARLEICAHRPAPVQVTYLGFPGSSGAAFFDYAVVDDVVVPAGDEATFSEALIRLPGCYQVNDHGRAIAAAPAHRTDADLPEDGFAFACLNRVYKIEADCFAAWMRILQAVPDSRLWLLDGGERANTNLGAAATAAGLDPARLVFLPMLPHDQHLARLKLADLGLDTWTVNAHTTASDALWAGLPVVTLRGPHFASRVASSVLSAAGLRELATETAADYEALAVGLAGDPARLESMRAGLQTDREARPLFDTPAFVAHLERALETAWARHRAGQAPATITL